MQCHDAQTDRNVLIMEADDELNTQPPIVLINDVEKRIDQGLRKIVVACSNVAFLYTPGIIALVSFHVRLKKRGGHLVVCSVNKRLAELFATVRPDHLLDIQCDLAEALAAMQRYHVN